MYICVYVCVSNIYVYVLVFSLCIFIFAPFFFCGCAESFFFSIFLVVSSFLFPSTINTTYYWFLDITVPGNYCSK